jgi:hypothetical protein
MKILKKVNIVQMVIKKTVRKIEKQVTNSIKYSRKMEKLAKLHRMWRYKKKIAKNVLKN